MTDKELIDAMVDNREQIKRLKEEAAALQKTILTNYKDAINITGYRYDGKCPECLGVEVGFYGSPEKLYLSEVILGITQEKQTGWWPLEKEDVERLTASSPEYNEEEVRRTPLNCWVKEQQSIVDEAIAEKEAEIKELKSKRDTLTRFPYSS